MCYAKSETAAKHYLCQQDVRGTVTKDFLAVVQNAPPRDAGTLAIK
jgi:hypothetical protein